MEPFEYRGMWWHPAYPKVQFVGILKFEPNSGSYLEIVGSDLNTILYQTEATLNAKRKKPKYLLGRSTASRGNFDILHGSTNKGERVTLWNVLDAGFSAAAGYQSSKFRAEIVIIGAHFRHNEGVMLRSIKVYYTHLEDWLGDITFQSKASRDKSKLTIAYSHPKPVETIINNLKVRFSSHLRPNPDKEYFLSVKRVSSIEVFPSPETHLNALLVGPIRLLRDFLLLGIGATLQTIEITGQIKKSANVIADQEKVRIYFRPDGIDTPKYAGFSKFDMWFRYEDVSDNFPNYLNRWFEIADDLKPVFDLYFGLFYIPSIYINLEFLTLVQALEVYCDRMIKNPQLLELEKRIAYLLEKHLEPYSTIIRRVIPNQKEFAGRLKQTRHYLTHYSKEREKKATKEELELSRYIQVMGLLLQLCLFYELGFSEDLVSKLASKSRSFRRFFY